ncbi:MAG: carboxymuconolactone decarboxylase family protein, partial [Plantibacter flavus]
LITLAALVALGGLEPQLRGHTRGAINVGCSATEILETVIHTVQYAGFPRALNAIRVVTDALIEVGVEIPEPLGPDRTGPEPRDQQPGSAQDRPGPGDLD